MAEAGDPWVDEWEIRAGDDIADGIKQVMFGSRAGIGKPPPPAPAGGETLLLPCPHENWGKSS